jgi:biopolymer transport protein ExbD
MARVALVGIAVILGCAACSTTRISNSSSPINVYLGDNGNLAAQGYTLAEADFSTFAKEVGSREVVILPNNYPSYGSAVRARDQLRAAGVQNVIIGAKPE